MIVLPPLLLGPLVGILLTFLLVVRKSPELALDTAGSATAEASLQPPKPKGSEVLKGFLQLKKGLLMERAEKASATPDAEDHQVLHVASLCAKIRSLIYGGTAAEEEKEKVYAALVSDTEGGIPSDDLLEAISSVRSRSSRDGASEATSTSLPQQQPNLRQRIAAKIGAAASSSVESKDPVTRSGTEKKEAPLGMLAGIKERWARPATVDEAGKSSAPEDKGQADGGQQKPALLQRLSGGFRSPLEAVASMSAPAAADNEDSNKRFFQGPVASFIHSKFRNRDSDAATGQEAGRA